MYTVHVHVIVHVIVDVLILCCLLGGIADWIVSGGLHFCYVVSHSIGVESQYCPAQIDSRYRMRTLGRLCERERGTKRYCKYKPVALWQSETVCSW